MAHVFLTGSKQIGKSTMIRQCLKEQAFNVGGFLTRKHYDEAAGTNGVHLLRPDLNEMPCGDNLLFYCGRRNEGITDRFDSLGTRALTPILSGMSRPDLILMDEIGPHEADAVRFRETVLALLEQKDIPILGVLQKGSYPLFDEIASRRRVILAEVTKENRDTDPSRLLSYLFSYNTIPSYGSVTIVRGDHEAFVLMVSGYHGWSFPKGHLEPFETPVEAAARETYEETGVHITIDPSRSYRVPSARPGDQNTVTFFAGHCTDGICPVYAQEGEIAEAAWVPLSEAASRIGYGPDRDVLAYFQRSIG